MSSRHSKLISKRKSAKQQRSIAKVELILETTLRMLSEGPADNVTTNAIATKAEISVGTLYQFFPNKEAIFYELYRNWLDQTLESIDTVSESFSDTENPHQVIDAVLESLSVKGKINTVGHWQLSRAMGSTEGLAFLEAQHKVQIHERLQNLQEKFGKKLPPGKEHVLTSLQSQVMIACLVTLARSKGDEEKQLLETRQGKAMGILMISDPSGQYEAVIFEEGLNRFRDQLLPGQSVVLQVGADLREEGVSIRINSVEPIEKVAHREERDMVIFLRDPEPLRHVSSILRQGGNGKVLFVVIRENGAREIEIQLPDRYQVTSKIQSAIKGLDGVLDVQVA